MSHESIAELNLAYSRLERQGREPGKFRLLVLPGEAGRSGTQIINQVLRQNESFDMSLAEDLTRTLRVVAADFRGYCAPDTVSMAYWAEKLVELTTRVKEISGFLPQSVLTPLEELANRLVEWGTRSSQELFQALEAEVSLREGRVALVLSTPRLSNHVGEWLAGWSENEKITVARSASLRSLEITEIESVIFMGAPHRLFRSPKLEKLARALCLSGASEDVAFIAPRWACSPADESALQLLLPFQSDTKLPKVLPIATGQAPLVNAIADEIEDEDLAPATEEVPAVVPSLRAGTTPCRLLHLGERFSLPVEEDASRVTALQKDAISDQWEAHGRHPYDELHIGDLVLAIIDPSETNDLRKRAGFAMGEKFPVYENGQKSWKSKLSEMEHRFGRNILEKQLQAAGISAGHRFSYWSEPGTISPQMNEDFRKLLLFLGFTPSEANRTMELTREFRAHLIAEGLRAGLEVVRVLNEEESDPSHFDQGRTVILKELGNASYLVAPVTSVSSEVIMCDPSQVRSLVARNHRGTS